MTLRRCIAIAVLGASHPGYADHQHTTGHDGSAFGAGVSVVAASFDTMTYVGNYQGVVPAVRWSDARFAAGASAALYRLEKNGAHAYGFGDVVVHGQVALVGGARAHAGVV